MKDITTLTVKVSTWKRLVNYKTEPSMTWDQVINNILDALEKKGKNSKVG